MIKHHCDWCDKVTLKKDLNQVSSRFYVEREYQDNGYELCKECLAHFKRMVSNFRESLHKNAKA